MIKKQQRNNKQTMKNNKQIWKAINDKETNSKQMINSNVQNKQKWMNNKQTEHD